VLLCSAAQLRSLADQPRPRLPDERLRNQGDRLFQKLLVRGRGFEIERRIELTKALNNSAATRL
jgi:hypothetical protein